MNIRLSPHGEELVNDQLSRGAFRSPEEVIERGLEMLAERQQQPDDPLVAEFEAILDALAEGSDKLQILPEKATSRTAIYRHDA